ncbi:helix-turn-helix domain-containing protein [Plantactinospora sp. CA-290183]|uniref:helix-turn-helix domain-containing protein n=1 Tax=Plantactinospora sp. CA-290183 TaxID=3240006 RepID=UPI003D89E14D
MPDSHLGALLGSTLRRQRELRDLSQHALAERSGINQSTIARIEQGTRAPSVPMLVRLFAALGLQLTVGVEPLDAHLDARIDELRDRPIDEHIHHLGLDRIMGRLGDLPYVLTGTTAALLQGAPLPAEDVEIAVAWGDADRFADWLDRHHAQRWHPAWQEFGHLRTHPRDPGEHRWRVIGGVIRATMCDEPPPAIEVRPRGPGLPGGAAGAGGGHRAGDGGTPAPPPHPVRRRALRCGVSRLTGPTQSSAARRRPGPCSRR